ncbi:MAG TPA: hypothetical protein VFW35_04850 [Sphingomicrobium sp.]|nr:hypothetical protein [Sphingomicrobium sp.]
MPMRSFNLKHGTVVPHPENESDDPGRTITSEPMRMAENGWVQQACGGESVQRREDHITDEEERAAREWLAHVEAGRIGGRR